MTRRARRRIHPATPPAITLAAIFALLLAGECLLRRTGHFADYYESNGLSRGPLEEKLRQPFLLVYGENATREETKTEFSFKTQYNEEGLPGALPTLKKSRSEYRIIAIGDSFTEGIGDTDGPGYVGRLERRLNRTKRLPRTTVMNAGVSGSDPVFGLELLRRKLLKYRPDLVLLTVNHSDIGDLKRRGGLDRFTPDGALLRRPPSWAWAFNRSHLVRAFVLGWMDYNWEYESPAESKASYRTVVRDIVRAGVLAKELGEAHGFKVLIVVHPDPSELAATERRLITVKIKELLEARKVDVADLLPGFLDEIPQPISTEYYWPLDSHFTSKGYEVFAKVLEAELKRRGYPGRRSRPMTPEVEPD